MHEQGARFKTWDYYFSIWAVTEVPNRKILENKFSKQAVNAVQCASKARQNASNGQ
jgi:hypothetical protein